MQNHQTQFPNPTFVTMFYPTSTELYSLTIEQMWGQIYQQNIEIAQLRSQNQNLKSLLVHSESQKTSTDSKSSESAESHHPQKLQRKQKPKRNFHCQYEKCDRVYASCLALNLHIKTKHNGGTKKERDAYAKLIALAEIKGLARPQISFNFPKNYIENMKEKLLAEQNSSKN